MSALQSADKDQANPDDPVEIGRATIAAAVDALGALSDGLDGAFTAAVEALYGASGRVICVGVGKSGHVARKMAATFSSTGSPAYFVHPNEASHGDLGMIAPGDAVIALSRSGETSELNDLIQYTRRFAMPLIGVTAEPDSALARAADVSLILPPHREACAETRAPTTSTTLMMALGDALAVALLTRRGFRAEDFRIYHPGGRLGAMLLRVADLMHGPDDLPLIPSGASLMAGLEQISAKRFGCVGVADSAGRLLGMITDGDVRRLLAAGASPATVDEAMTSNPLILNSDLLAAAALKTLNDRKITQAFVVEAGRPVGLVHVHDLLRRGVS